MPDSIQPVRIVIADDHPISRHGLHWLLESESGLVVIGETGDASEAAALVRDRWADILLLDFSLNSQPALDALQQIAASGTCVRTIILAERADTPGLPKAVQLGIRGLVLKNSAAEVLFRSIHSVMAGHYWLDGDRALDGPVSLRSLQGNRRRHKAFGLTPRELEVIRTLTAGWTNEEIAQSLAITENTVKSHLTHIFNKVGASNRVELVSFAAYHGLLGGI